MENFLEEVRKAAKRKIVEEVKMRCLYCDGKMEKIKVGYSINRKNYHLYLEGVPAYVCLKCKEKFFEEKETAAIQKLIKHLESDVHQLQLV